MAITFTTVNGLQFMIYAAFLHQRFYKELRKSIECTVEVILLYVKVKHSLSTHTIAQTYD